MKILDRYLTTQFLSTFALVLLALPFLFVLTDLTDNLDRYLARGLSLGTVATSYLYFVPQLIFWGFPIAALIATVFTIGRMTRYQEIVAAKAGGVSFYRVAAPVFLLAALLSGAAVLIGEAVPVTNARRAEMLGERERFTTPFRNNLVFRSESGKTISANRLNVFANDMANVVIERRDDEAGLHVHQAAESAVWTDDRGWTLYNGYLRWLDDSGDQVTFQFASLQAADVPERPEELLLGTREPEEMRYAELERLIRTVERSGGEAGALRVSLAQKVSLPLAVLVIVLFGAPLATSSRRGGTAFGVGISLAVTLVYLMLFKVGEATGASGAVDPIVAAWAPNVLFLVSAVVLLWRVRT